MNNTELQRLFDTYGDRIFLIHFNDTKILFLGYNGSPTIADVSLETKGGAEYIIVKRIDKSHATPIEFEMRWLTSYVESIGIVSEKDKDYRPDPVLFK